MQMNLCTLMNCKVAGNNTTVKSGQQVTGGFHKPQQKDQQMLILMTLSKTHWQEVAKMTQIHESQRKQIPDNDKNKPFITIPTKVLQPVGS